MRNYSAWSDDEAAYIPSCFPPTHASHPPWGSKPTCPNPSAPIISSRPGTGGHIGRNVAAVVMGLQACDQAFQALSSFR